MQEKMFEEGDRWRAERGLTLDEFGSVGKKSEAGKEEAKTAAAAAAR